MDGLQASVVFDYSNRNANKSMLWSGIIALTLSGHSEPFMTFECRLITGKNGEFIGFADRKYENAVGETKYHKIMGPNFDRDAGKPSPEGQAFQDMVLKAVQDHRGGQGDGDLDDQDIPF